MGITDGLGFEEVNQEVTSTAVLSGTNVYGATSVRSPLVVAANVSGTTAVRGASIIGTTVASALGQLGPVGTGSPTAFGLSMQTGAATASNAAVTVTFGTAFRATPQIIVTPLGSSTIAGVASGASATAFGLLGTSGMSHSWLAIGSM